MKAVSQIWLSESNQNGDEEVAYQDRFADPETGVRVMRMTSQPCINHAIYPETPVGTRDGRRFVFARLAPLSTRTTFWMADIAIRRSRQMTDEEGAASPIITPDGRWFYYSVGRSIRRLSSETFEREEVFEVPASVPTVGAIVSVSRDGTRFLAPASRTEGLYGVAVIDIARSTVNVVAEGPDVRNPHPQFSLDGKDRIMVQVNDSIEVDGAGNILRLVGPMGASLHVLEADGSGQVKLAVGSSPIERVQGHECWVPGENRVITTLHRRRDPSSPWVQDRIVTVAPGEKTCRVVGEGEAFCHIHVSPDARYWVSDCNRTARVHVGSLATGRHRLFCSSGSTFGSAQYTHPHPFFLGDGRAIGWNSDVTGVPHVYYAKIPDGFLGSLD